jgi:hypothetical protein
MEGDTTSCSVMARETNMNHLGSKSADFSWLFMKVRKVRVAGEGACWHHHRQRALKDNSHSSLRCVCQHFECLDSLCCGCFTIPCDQVLLTLASPTGGGTGPVWRHAGSEQCGLVLSSVSTFAPAKVCATMTKAPPCVQPLWFIPDCLAPFAKGESKVLPLPDLHALSLQCSLQPSCGW